MYIIALGPHVILKLRNRSKAKILSVLAPSTSHIIYDNVEYNGISSSSMFKEESYISPEKQKKYDARCKYKTHAENSLTIMEQTFYESYRSR